METLLPWVALAKMLPFMFFGLFVHALGKYILARKKSGYRFGTFLYRMRFAWVLSLCYAAIGCWLFLRGVGTSFGQTWDVVALLMGITGGSLGKTTVNLLTRKKGLKND